MVHYRVYTAVCCIIYCGCCTLHICTYCVYSVVNTLHRNRHYRYRYCTIVYTVHAANIIWYSIIVLCVLVHTQYIQYTYSSRQIHTYCTHSVQYTYSSRQRATASRAGHTTKKARLHKKKGPPYTDIIAMYE